MWIHQLKSSVAIPWNVWEKCDPAWGDHFIQEDTVSVVGSARAHFAISINLHVPPKSIFLWRWARRVRESGWGSGIACCWRSWQNWWRCEEGDTRHTSRVKMSMLFVVLPRWRSPSLSCRVSFSQRFSEKRTGGTDFVWVCFWHRSTSAMWVFKSSYLISFWFAGIIWCTHIFHKLVISAHLFMKMTSWGYCVLVYTCSGEPFVRPGFSGTSRIDSVVIRVFEVVAPTSEEDVRKRASRKRSLTATLES